MRMVELVLRERSMDCRRRIQHKKKFASVLDDIRREHFMLLWVVSGSLNVILALKVIP